MTPRQALSWHAALSRSRAWLSRLIDDDAYDEWEEDTDPTRPNADEAGDSRG